MAKATRICGICGKEYPYCKTFRQVKFRWQDVACCPEHGYEYFRRVMESRDEATEELSAAFPQFAADNNAGEAAEPETGTDDYVAESEQDADDEWEFEDESQDE